MGHLTDRLESFGDNQLAAAQKTEASGSESLAAEVRDWAAVGFHNVLGYVALVTSYALDEIQQIPDVLKNDD